MHVYMCVSLQKSAIKILIKTDLKYKEQKGESPLVPVLCSSSVLQALPLHVPHPSTCVLVDAEGFQASASS